MSPFKSTIAGMLLALAACGDKNTALPLAHATRDARLNRRKQK